ncbi:NAD(P)-dependent oxidoreductase [Kineosporia sp. A_224]|uniref:NAD-dependent epimerase/dehydratase family protein n=1 Tax=Kineosporia sp. A_224 TaxID=1962180 RepID=UPI000B4AB3E8|nr:NAD(P)-dependent oxidoreductase [Kineosporia sp. A_224]
MSTTVCVTGAAGKVGRYAVHELLEHGYRVVAVDTVAHPPTLPAVWSRDDFTYLRADLEDFGDTVDALGGCDAVVHVANIPAPGLIPPARTLNRNNLMNTNVFLAAAQLRLTKVVWASSETTLGLNFGDGGRAPRYVPLDEDHYPHPATTYSLSKVVAETTAEHVAAWSGIPFLALRFSNVILPEEYAAFPTYWSDPASRVFNLWSYIDVRDAALACRLALESDVTGARAYVIANEDSVMTTPSADLVEQVFPGTPHKTPVEGNASLMTSARARAELGFVPQHPWRDQVQVPPAG